MRISNELGDDACNRLRHGQQSCKCRTQTGAEDSCFANGRIAHAVRGKLLTTYSAVEFNH